MSNSKQQPHGGNQPANAQPAGLPIGFILLLLLIAFGVLMIVGKVVGLY